MIFEEQSLVDSEVYFEGIVDEGAYERRFETLRWIVWKIDNSFYAKKEFRIKTKVYRRPRLTECEAGSLMLS